MKKFKKLRAGICGIAAVVGIMLTPGYIVSANSSSLSEANPGVVISGSNNKVYGDIIYNNPEGGGSDASDSVNSLDDYVLKKYTATSDVEKVKVGVYSLKISREEGKATTYSFIAGTDERHGYSISIPESVYQSYVKVQDNEITITVNKAVIQEDSSTRGIFERCSFLWDTDDRSFTDTELTEFKKIIYADSKNKTESIRKKFGLGYCYIDCNESGLQISEHDDKWIGGTIMLGVLSTFLLVFTGMLLYFSF